MTLKYSNQVPKTNRNKAVIYSRVSTDEQAENGFSLQDQEARLTRHCVENNIEIIRHYKEDHSAKDFNRPEFKKFLSDLEDKTFKPDLFLTVRSDRFSRNLEATLAVTKSLNSKGIQVKFLEGMEYNPKIPETLIPYLIDVALPEIDNSKRSINTIRGLRQAQRLGRWVSTAPKGYSLINKSLIPNDDASFIVEAFTEVAKGIEPTEHTRLKLRKKGFKGCKNGFYHILRNLVYVGKIRIKAWQDEAEEIVVGLHDPIIDQELFDRVQEVFESRTKRNFKPNKINDNLPLRGFLKCPDCGHKLTGSTSKKKYHYYHCQAKYSCGYRISAEIANSKMLDFMKNLEVSQEIVELYLEIMKDIFKSSEEDRLKELNKLDIEINKLKDRIEKAEDDFLDRILDQSSYERIIKRTSNARDELILRRTQIAMVESAFMKYYRYGLYLISNLSRMYSDSTTLAKRKILSSIFPELILFDGEKYRTPSKNPAFGIFSLKIKDLAAVKIEKAGGDLQPVQLGSPSWTRTKDPLINSQML